MIRKPAAKGQAELLMREFQKDGHTLSRGRALDLVAKLQGYRNWNVYCQAEKAFTPTTPASVAAPVKETPQYLVEVPAKLADRLHNVSDTRLAAHLSHSKKETTTLLRHTLNGVNYALQLCGAVRGIITDQADRRYVFDSSQGIGRAMLVAIEDSNNRVDLASNAWFEWIDEEGHPVGEPFSDISLDPAVELTNLAALLKVSV